MTVLGSAPVGGAQAARAALRSRVGEPPAPAPAPANLLRIATFNVENFFDTVDDKTIGDTIETPEAYKTKLTKLSLAIREKLGTPDVIGLSEVENQQVLNDLLALPEMAKLGYKSIMGERNDRRGISNAMLYRDSLLEVRKVENWNPTVKMPDSANGQFDRAKLYSRAPLVVDFALRGGAQAQEGAALITVIGNHFKSKLGGSGPEPRRQAQGEYLGGFVDARRAASPQTSVIVMGDLNALYDDGAYLKLAKGKDGKPRLWDTPLSLPDADRYTYLYKGKPNMLDHLMVTPELQKAHVSTSIPHFNSAAPKAAKQDPTVAARVSDHDPMIATFDLAKLLQARAAAA